MKLGLIGYYTDFVVYPVLIAALCVFGFLSGDAPTWLGIVAASLLGWTLIEYVLHRFGFHHVPGLREMHREHHVEEKEPIGTPSWVSLGMFAVVLVLPFWWQFGWFVTSAMTAGLMAGYLWYISVHHIVHHWHPPHGGYVYGLKRRHALHHHFNEDANFGVTSGFWDRVFGTAADMKERRRNAPVSQSQL